MSAAARSAPLPHINATPRAALLIVSNCLITQGVTHGSISLRTFTVNGQDTNNKEMQQNIAFCGTKAYVSLRKQSIQLL